MVGSGKGWRYFHSPEMTSSTSESVPIQNEFTNRIQKNKKVSTPEDKLKRATKKKEIAKKKQEKKRRVIIRNLSFKIDEKELKNILSKYGNVTDLKIPKKPDGKKKGFAFAQFEKFQSTVQAIKNLNYKELHGRPIAIDYALPKDKYENINFSKVKKDQDSTPDDKSVKDESSSESEASDDENLDAGVKEDDEDNVNDKSANDNEDRVDDLLKELEFNDTDDEIEGGDNEDASDSSEDEDDVDSNKMEDEESCDDKSSITSPTKSKSGPEKSKKMSSNDVQEGKTVFVRNIPFDTTQENFKEAMEEFGSVKYCLLCIDPVTEFPRGTAFVKFENKDDAEKLIKKSSDEMGSGVYLENRKLYCVPAISREEVIKKNAGDPKERKDKRNLRLLREGLIMADSEEAKAVSQTDLAKRSKLEIMKKQKLKNLNFFVSETRLCIHNLPPDYTDQQLRRLFKEAVPEKTVVPEARIMRDMKKLNEKGDAKSKGFGFVSFTKHEHALEALRKLNNNASVFSDQKRPIVEFSVENHMALLSKQRRREKSKLRNKRKEQEAEDQNNDDQAPQFQKDSDTRHRRKKQRITKPKDHPMKKNFPQKFQKQSPSTETGAEESKKTKNKKAKKKKGVMKKGDYKTITNLADQYKTKLLNKLI